MRLRLALLSSILWAVPAFAQDIGIKRFQGNHTGTEQVVIAAPGVGKQICVRSVVLSTEDSNTDWRFLQKRGTFPTPTPAPTATGTPVATPTATATPTSAAIAPNSDYQSNSGVVLPPDESCWFILAENSALVVTSNNPVDIFGTYKIVRTNG